MLVQVLRDSGPAISGADLEELCVGAGMNPISFYIYRAGSPVVSQMAPGVYSLVGATPPFGLVEEIASKSRTSRRMVEHGWDNEGRLWCAVSLSRAVITAGSIALPRFVRDLVQGEWTITLPDGTEAGTTIYNGAFLTGLRKPLSYSGAEPGDLVLLEFDLHSHVMKMRVGGQELIDLAQSGALDDKTED
jgi:hypothetical protein